MVDGDERRESMQQERLTHQLKMQTMQLQNLFDQHQLEANVTGGVVEPRTIQFDLQSQLFSQFDRLKGLTEEIKSVLRVPDLNLGKTQNGRLSVKVKREEAPVPFLDLFSLMPKLGQRTAVVGLAENGSPVLLKISPEETSHLLIVGGEGAGKTQLLRTIALSLALSNRQSQLQLVIIDPVLNDDEKKQKSPLTHLDYLPHLVMESARLREEIIDQLEFLVDEMLYRQEQGAQTPPIMVFVDRLVGLLDEDDNIINELLMQLAQQGAAAGIHLIVCVEKPNSSKLNRLLLNNFPLRLVGRTKDEAESVAAAGVSDSQAHYLLGNGDFLAISEKQLTHFQAAFINDTDLHMCLERMVHAVRRRLVAKPAALRHQMPPIGMIDKSMQAPISLSGYDPEKASSLQSSDRQRPAVRSRYDFI